MQSATADSTNEQQVAKKQKREQVAGKQLKNDTDVLRVVIESILHRRAKFSTAIISEAVQVIPPKQCALIIRVAALTMLDMCSMTLCHRQPLNLLEYYGDDQLVRAIEWVEAIMDSHFASFALEAAQASDIRKALKTLVHLCGQADRALETVENVIGELCEIMNNSNKVQQSLLQRNQGIYSIDILRL